MGFENGHLARVVLSAAKGDKQVVNTLHYDLKGTLTDASASLQSLADRIKDDLQAAYAVFFTADWTVAPVEVWDEKDPQHPTAARSAAVSGVSIPGTHGPVPGGSRLPLEMCPVATLRTAHIGRRFRGRMFLPPMTSEDDIGDGVMNGGTVTAYQDFCDLIPREPDLVEGASGATSLWCVYSRTQRAANLDPYANAITEAVVGSKVHWLRSRGN